MTKLDQLSDYDFNTMEEKAREIKQQGGQCINDMAIDLCSYMGLYSDCERHVDFCAGFFLD